MSEYCEKILVEARKMIGKETSIRWAEYPVEYEPIRRWCHMIKCNNPLYLDEKYAKKTKWGGIVCPPPMVSMFAQGFSAGPRASASGPEIVWPYQTPATDEERIDPPTAGMAAVVLGGETEFFKPLYIGDRVGSKRRLVDVYIKKTRLDPEGFWIATDGIVVNQNLETVSISHTLIIRHRTREEIKATTPEQLELMDK